MRYIFGMWAAPMAIFWGWFYLSANDINFGYVMFSRQTHDFFFQLYGQILGIDPSIIPGMVAKTCVFDGLLLTALWAFRRRREILGWVSRRWTGPVRFDRLHRATEAGPKLPAE
ncbi:MULTISPECIES: DUF6105 family protein [unclassified Mesorhizobium]|uniref:DUF6105 family protein n=1 Tax=unclassified Mesorhizobium TaxID=325217 RepID=UPI000FC999C6|nr:MULTISPECIES: DUF6105 family protein [unclassified Mesorhizobium]TGR39440.1 hypothetical protein EN842_40065 [bacterium M00.F.Ca.ET.199.01.1.1]TGU28876.1 hypothetical protein EN799_35245 [bacterium M00.F.Ca.ET.156.01.1.1]TGV61554.1 hypothetical protein EN784_04030 [bacterium M00.F.Ca.ET.141.01.1.1]TGV84422.1 hypothetical protein EN792_022245 [Mesorhizobium sp. M00.F.Ca.ET.149.01.1.1]RUW51040.1 hypothetical protein EOA36_15315 [Mesorhizobium sp. M8A.F.Ca.ET.021.01.1.1]